MDKLSNACPHDRRSSRRHNIKTSLRVRVWRSGLPEERAESVNLSQRGIFFLADRRLAEGEIIEVLLKMPEEVTGQPTTEWRCTGFVDIQLQLTKAMGPIVGVGSVVRVAAANHMGIHLGRLGFPESQKLQDFLLPLIPD